MTAPAAYGSWPSPLSAAQVARGSLRISDPQIDGDSIYWIESRPAEQGRCVVVRHRSGRTDDVLPPPYSARTTVHEYGGGALHVAGGVAFFANMADQRVYRADGSDIAPVSAEAGDVRYADMVVDRKGARVISVVEDHRGAAVVNDLRAVSLAGGRATTLVTGNDFYAAPRLSPDGTQLAWLTWNQPNMPWDGTELWVGGLDEDGGVTDARLVAGGPKESVFQPAWSPSGTLHFCSDRTGFWNLYRLSEGEVSPVAPMDADCGEAMWVFGLSTYAFCGDGRIATVAVAHGIWRMRLHDARSGVVLVDFDLPFTSMRQVVADGDSVVVVAGGPRHPKSVVRIDARSGAFEVLRAASPTAVDESVLSIPQAVTFEGSGGVESHAFFYAPRNDAVTPAADERPPLVVHAHGGPTSATDTTLNETIQFWTSRGFAYVDVNYGGSTGHGRAYRERLYGQEGVVDVEDCIAAGQHLARQGLVDGSRVMVSGGSAGGYIVLCAMTFHDVFASGANSYGICDWETMLEGTHKFEARYFDFMIGPYPERRDLFYERAPIHFIDRLRRPLLILQGLEDRVVPPSQSQTVYDALRARGVPCAYLAFEGEQHGFRQQTTIRRALEAELLFFCTVLGIEPADSIEPIDIANADRL